MLDYIAHMQFRTHAVHIRQDPESGRIYCFKYTPSRCDLASFESGDQAADYILEPFTSLVWYVSVVEDTDQQIPE